MRYIVVAAAATLLGASSVHAQSEATLRAALEGKTVTVKVDMPGTSRGIDVFPLEPAPIDWREVAERTKEYGTALGIGDKVMITKVVVKKNSHIEFQLGGGGWGTFLDSPGTSSVYTSDQGETKYERALRDSIKSAPGPTRRKQLERELSSAREERERENSRARAEAQQANAAHEANVRAKRQQSGSRFNLRFKNGIPPEFLTPAGVMAALAEYVDFPAAGPKVAATPAASAPAQGVSGASPPAAAPAPEPQSGPAASAPAPGGAAAIGKLRKGLTVREVEELLGPADTAGEVKEGSLTVVKRSYTSEGMKVATRFMNGVLIDFVITPRGA